MISTRRPEHMLSSRRGIKMREFNELMAADTFAAAICHLTGARLGSVMVERRRRVLQNEAPSDTGERQGQHGTGAFPGGKARERAKANC